MYRKGEIVKLFKKPFKKKKTEILDEPLVEMINEMKIRCLAGKLLESRKVFPEQSSRNNDFQRCILYDVPNRDDVSILLDDEGNPTGKFLQSEQIMIPFNKVSTGKFRVQGKTLKEIRVLCGSILARKENQRLVGLLDASCAASGNISACSSPYLSRADLAVGASRVTQGNDFFHHLLMNKRDFLSVLTYEGVSDLDIQRFPDPGPQYADGEPNDIIFIKGILSGECTCRINGLKVVIPHDDDTLETGAIYVVGTPCHVGPYYADSHAIEIVRDLDELFCMAKFESAMNINNVYSISKIIIESWKGAKRS
jgi:hypothetical protein